MWLQETSNGKLHEHWKELECTYTAELFIHGSKYTNLNMETNKHNY